MRSGRVGLGSVSGGSRVLWVGGPCVLEHEGRSRRAVDLPKHPACQAGGPIEGRETMCGAGCDEAGATGSRWAGAVAASPAAKATPCSMRVGFFDEGRGAAPETMAGSGGRGAGHLEGGAFCHLLSVPMRLIRGMSPSPRHISGSPPSLSTAARPPPSFHPASTTSPHRLPAPQGRLASLRMSRLGLGPGTGSGEGRGRLWWACVGWIG